VTVSTELVAQLLSRLPEAHTAELLYTRLIENKPSLARLFEKEPGLLSDVLDLAAWSPLLAATLEHYPDYVSWLQRERHSPRVRAHEELGESLARFALTNSQLDPHVMLARFRRRELLRTYLHDIRGARTVVETTEELSNLADVILEYALKFSRQELDNRYGAPQRVDERGRISPAEFCIVAMGKLGSRELNYASDIDLIFLYSDEGTTASGGARGQVTNREYFVKLGESILRMVGEQRGEGAAYRIDVRLRPHGRVGTLANFLGEAVRYYEEMARDWELQTLIRARAAAGSQQLYTRFASRIVGRVFRADSNVGAALASVRLSREKIDRQREPAAKGFNVKLGRGGIREIEFIAQALQVAFGGRDPWLRAPHTLITLGRLTDRGLITETEHSQLSDAYHFLRALEHRLQMEHGLQTHSLPDDPRSRELVARRMKCDSLSEFELELERHTNNVRKTFDRVFGNVAAPEPIKPARPAGIDEGLADPDAALARLAASVFSKHLVDQIDVGQLADMLRRTAAASLNSHRALSFAARVAGSLDKSSEPITVSLAELSRLVELCGVSEFFGEMIAGYPALIHAVSLRADQLRQRDYLLELSAPVKEQTDFHGELEALRRSWSALLLEIGSADSDRTIELAETNELLTRLARAAMNAALLVARREFVRRYGEFVTEPRLAVLGLGRLGSAGMDYGSDLDVVITFDSGAISPVTSLTPEEAYARLTELMITALSSITRSGYLYRVDLRLRPDGQKGPLVTGSESLIEYLKRRASIWEWLAYVKLRAVAGDLSLGAEVESACRKVIHEMARQIDPNQLRDETRRVRERLEKEKIRRRDSGVEIKYGAGGMLDVYFVARYLQLRDGVQDDDKNRTTAATLRLLRAAGSLGETDFASLDQGYALLRSVDHQLRLIIGRSTRLPAPDHPAFRDLARRLGCGTEARLNQDLTRRMEEIREVYERFTRG
jgi:[glutamine synthetase] adenylyltransferase / [glutamine synthetase]-adenylyl-L-tyrosine phosphorylase